ncbi:MAG: methionyl-tRNA formyltransferase, partial [Oscillospiraceae bacterium]
MNIVFMGTPDFAVPCIKALIESGENVQAVFTQPDKPKGRGYKLTPPPVKEIALTYNIPVYQPVSLKKGDDAENSLKILKELSPDLIIVVAYGKILPKAILDIPKYCINVHASLLPKYRGAGPIQWSVLNGEKVTGVTTMLMAEGLDTGDMLLSKSVEIGDNETASELHDRLSVLGAEVLLETIKAVKADDLIPIKQDDSLSNYAPMLTKDMCP